jgi:glycosyltransferase involved in cell wall biosynthesis
MRIGIDLLFLVASKGGGIERHIRCVLDRLQQLAEHEIVLFTNRECRGSFPLTPNVTEVPSDVSATFRPAKILWEQMVLPLQIAQQRIDVLLAPGNVSPLAHRCPSAVIIHDMIPFVRPEVFTRRERIALQTLFRLSALRNQIVLTVSESSRGEIIRRLKVPPEKVLVIPGGCDRRFRPVPHTNETRGTLAALGISEPYLLYVAASRTYKNVHGLLRAFKLLKERHAIPHSLVLTGLADRAQTELVALVQQLGLTRDVVFSGFLDDQVLPLIYSAADVLVYPSFYEGFGLPVIEAMACGTPVAASNTTSLPEAVGDAGLLFDPSSNDDMARTIHRLIVDRALHAELARKGLARAQTFSWDTTAQRTLAALTSIVRS